MAVELLREQLARVRELTAQLNAHSDEANRIVAAVETFLSDVCNVGVDGSISIGGEADQDGPHWERLLRYGRFSDANTVFS
jgi:hypothetical protein